MQWLARMTTNPLARVRSLMKAVSATLIQLFILPNGLVDKCVPRETWGKINCVKSNVIVALCPGVMD